MRVIIDRHGTNIQWGGVYYFSPPDYPEISEWDLRNLVLFAEYELKYGRDTVVECGDEAIECAVNYALAHPKSVLPANKPELITGQPDCAGCRQGGCHTRLVCHTAGIQDAKSILTSGRILSAVRARGVPGSVLALEARNAAGDPPDYFDHAMFAWGNCQAGDRLVMERLLGRSPGDYDFGRGFRPGARFFFRYDELAENENAVFDGYHPIKISGGLALEEHPFACIVPENHRSEFERIVPAGLSGRVHYLESDGLDLLEWTDAAHNFALKIL